MLLTLTNLPAELIEAVAGAGEKRNVLALRCVSRKLRDHTEDTFIENFFVSRRHALTKHSLRVLLEISGSPHFRKKLRSLELVVLGKSSFPYFEWALGISLTNSTTREVKKKAQQHKDQQYGRKAKTLMPGSEDSTLSQLFSHFATAGIALNLRVSGFPHQSTDEIYGYSTFWRAIGLYDVETKFDGRSFDKQLCNIQKALHSSRLAMTSFTIKGQHTFLSFPKHLTAYQGWSTLRALRLYPDVHKSIVGHAYDNYGLKDAVGIATNLEELILEGKHYPWYTNHDYENWLRHLMSPFNAARLRSITLKGSTYGTDVLKSFLLGQKATLVSFKVKGRGFGTESDQVSMLLWLKSELDLAENSDWKNTPVEEDRSMYSGWNISVSKTLA